MLNIIKTSIVILMLSFQTANMTWASVDNHHHLIDRNKDIPEKSGKDLQGIVDARIAMYNKQYPEVFFMQLAGGGELIESLEILQLFLGHEPDNLDYEHPPELREDLLYVNLETLIMMLENNASSAALFRVGINSFAERDYMCVITLTPAAVAADDVMAMQDLMLDVSMQEFMSVDPVTYLNHHDYLRFVIDHEAYHCLDSMYNGPRPMSKFEYWGEYMAYHHHKGADAFALGMHIREHGGVTSFVKQLGNLRALSILYGDPNHYTYSIVRELLGSNPRIHAGLTVCELFNESSVMRDEVTPGYEAYLQFVSSAYEAMKRLGRASEIHPSMAGVMKPDEKLVQSLLSIVRTSYKNLFGNDLIPSKILH